MTPDNFIRTYKIQKLIKAVKDNKPRPGQNLTLRQARGEEANPNVPSMGSKGKEVPVGTIHNGRQKISANPSVWVDVATGHSYNEHSDKDYHKATEHPELSKFHEKLMSKLKGTMRSDHLARAEKMAEDYLQERLHAKNMMRAGNVESSRSGQIPTEHKNAYYKISDRAEKLKDKFIDYVKRAQKANKKV